MYLESNLRIILVYKNSGSGFASRIYDPSSCWLFARFEGPLTSSFLLLRPYIPLDSLWLSPRQKCHYCNIEYIVPDWSLLLLTGFRAFCPLSACMPPSDTVKFRIQGGGFQVSYSLTSPVLGSKEHTFKFQKAIKCNGDSMYCLDSLLLSTNNLNGGVSCLTLRIFKNYFDFIM